MFCHDRHKKWQLSCWACLIKTYHDADEKSQPKQALLGLTTLVVTTLTLKSCELFGLKSLFCFPVCIIKIFEGTIIIMVFYLILQRKKYIEVRFCPLLRPLPCLLRNMGSVALLSLITLKWSAILGRSFFSCAGGQRNPCYGVQVRLVNFVLHFKKC